jgi:serine/threonine protein kinase/tetratricopeptide (TPR) repeat protein
MLLQPGTRLGPYEIVALLGRGGMGEVYRATDTRVARTVAVKVLPPEAAANPDRRQRFEREARAVARLNHPHICALYDVGRQRDLEFLVMEYLDGETLAARLTRGALPLDEALGHASALAQALARAHREGITHRDLKPSNVMLTESGVKLLDFGLAKLRERDETGSPASPLDEQSTGEALSPEGTLVGTIAYMSPEQLEGHPVDSRTDIYALGLIVYEMITGQRAFAKGSQAGLIASILKEDPPAMTALQPKTPPAVERLVLTALAKDPDKRWQDAGDLAREIAWVATGSHTTTVDAARQRIPPRLRAWTLPAIAAVIIAATGASAVIWNRSRNPQSAFRNLVILPCRASADATAQAYCDGLTDTLSARMTPLAVARGLQITSTLEVRQRGVHDAAQARRDFGATLVLEGSILSAADALRANYVLVDAATLRQIDAFSATAPAGDPFALQDRVATWAAGVLELKLNAEQRHTLTAGGTRTPGALELYLQGRGYLLDFQKPGNIDKAIDTFNGAVALDAGYAQAHAGLGGAFWRKYEASQDTSRVQQARAACAQAVALDRELPASHVCAGTIALGTGQFAAAVEEFQRAVDRDPTNDEATLGLARAQARSGAVGEAEQTYRRAITLRPQYWATHVWLGTFYREQGRYAEAVQRYELALALTPDNARVYYILGGLYGSIGRYDDAIKACRRSAELVPSVEAYSNWGMTLFRQRRFDEAVARLEDARRIGPAVYRLEGNLARAYYFSGKRPDAMAAYARAIPLAEQTLAINSRDVDARVSLADYYAKSGDRVRAIDHINKLPPDLADPHVLLFGAFVFVDLDDRPAAFEWLERATRRGLTANELEEWIDLDPLKNDPRFAALPAK